MNRDEERFIQQAHASLQQGEADVPDHVVARLRKARHAAIASRYHRATPMWLPAMAAAMLMLVVGVTWFTGALYTGGPATLPAQQVASDFEMLVNSEDLELYADLDFYLWLEQKSKHAS